MNYKLVTWKIKSRKTHKKKKRKISEKSRNRNVPKIYELCVTNRKIRWKNKENLKPIKKGRKIESKKKKSRKIMAKIISICFELISHRVHTTHRKHCEQLEQQEQRKHFNSMIFLLANVQRYDGNKHDVKHDTLHFPVNSVKCHRLQTIYENSSIFFPLFSFSFSS